MSTNFYRLAIAGLIGLFIGGYADAHDVSLIRTMTTIFLVVAAYTLLCDLIQDWFRKGDDGPSG